MRLKYDIGPTINYYIIKDFYGFFVAEDHRIAFIVVKNYFDTSRKCVSDLLNLTATTGVFSLAIRHETFRGGKAIFNNASVCQCGRTYPLGKGAVCLIGQGCPNGYTAYVEYLSQQALLVLW